jgi:hypothetical protein
MIKIEFAATTTMRHMPWARKIVEESPLRPELGVELPSLVVEHFKIHIPASN